MVFAVVIFRHIRWAARLSKTLAYIEKHRRCIVPGGIFGKVGIAQEGDVRERLERRPRLAKSVGSDVEFTVNGLVPIVQTAHHRQHLTRTRAKHYDGGVADVMIHADVALAQRVKIVRRFAIRPTDSAGGLRVLSLEQGDVDAGRALGLMLQLKVNSGIDFEPTTVDHISSEAIDIFVFFEPLQNIGRKMRHLDVKTLLELAILQLKVLGRLCFFFCDLKAHTATTVNDHAVQRRLLALFGALTDFFIG